MSLTLLNEFERGPSGDGPASGDGSRRMSSLKRSNAFRRKQRPSLKSRPVQSSICGQICKLDPSPVPKSRGPPPPVPPKSTPKLPRVIAFQLKPEWKPEDGMPQLRCQNYSSDDGSTILDLFRKLRDSLSAVSERSSNQAERLHAISLLLPLEPPSGHDGSPRKALSDSGVSFEDGSVYQPCEFINFKTLEKLKIDGPDLDSFRASPDAPPVPPRRNRVSARQYNQRPDLPVNFKHPNGKPQALPANKMPDFDMVPIDLANLIRNPRRPKNAFIKKTYQKRPFKF